MKKSLLLLVCPLFLFIHCDLQRPLNMEDLIFLGDWSSDDYYIEIAANGYGFSQRRNREAIEGTVKITDTKIIFKGDNGREKFDIDELPFEENGEVMMVLDGGLFYKH